MKAEVISGPETPHSAFRLPTSWLIGLVTAVAGVIVLVGWFQDIPSLKSVLPGFVAMKANTAVGFVLAGLSLMLAGGVVRVALAWRGSQACAVAAALLGLLTLSQYLLGLDFGIDQLLFREPAGAVGTLAPGRMAPSTAVALVLLGCALLLAGSRRTLRAAQWLALMTGLMGLLPLMEYLYGAAMLSGLGHYTQMAVHTAMLFILGGLGVLFLRPAEGLMETVTGRTIGGWLVRSTVPLVFAVPVALGWLGIEGERRGYFERQFGIVLMLVVLMLLLTGLIWWAAQALNHLDSARRQAEAGLREREAFSRSVLDGVGANVAVLDRNGVIVAVNGAWLAFARENGEAAGGAGTGVGVDYLAVVRSAQGQTLAQADHRSQKSSTQRQRRGDSERSEKGEGEGEGEGEGKGEGDSSVEGAAEALAGIQDVLAGRRPGFTIEYPCHSPDQQRWFMLRAGPLPGEAGGAVLVHIDITARKEAELNMQASEMRYRRLFESAKDGILILDAGNGQIVDVNPFLVGLLGYPREEFLGKYLWEIGPFKDKAACKVSFEELQAMEYVRYDDLPLETSRGQKIAVEFVSNVYLVNNQKVIQCNIRNITERKKAEAALRASELEFRSLAESMPQIVWVTRPDGWNIYFNQQWVDYTGMTLEESHGHGWNIPFHPDDQQRAWDAWQNATQNNGLYSVECRLRRADGAYRWWLVRGVPLRDDGGKILKWFGTCTDIDDMKRAGVENRRLLEQSDRDRVGLLGILEDANRAAEALRAGTVFLNSLLEAMPVPVFYKDAGGRYLGVNPAFEAFFGKSHEAFVGKTVFDIAPRELAEVYQVKDAELFRNPGVQVYDAKMKDARGRMRDVVYHKATFTDAGGKVVGLVGAILDLTERKQAEEEKEQMRVQLLHSQRLESIGTLASGVAHEINNPINGIMNYARLIADRIEANSPLREYATEIMKETDRVALIVRNLLTFSRREKQSHSPARLVDIVEATLSLIRTIIRHDEIVLEVDVPEDLPLIRCRSQQMQQVLMNLLTNARDALNEKYPGAHEDKIVRISAQVIADGGLQIAESGRNGVDGAGIRGPQSVIRLTVEDHGAGIPPEFRGRIFDPFFSTKPRDKGTGLGLAISHGIVKDHHGRLTAESEVGQYTRMHVDLPV